MKVAVCIIVKDERRDLLEWIAFHHQTGFDTQIFIDNGSSDGTLECLRACQSSIDIRIHPWLNETKYFQNSAYQAIGNTYQYEFDWIAFVDADEFIILPTAVPLKTFLSRFDGVSGIAMNWAMYGSSHHVEYPQGLLTRAMLWRAESNFFPNRHVKSFIRPQNLIACGDPHVFEITGEYRTAAGRPFEQAIDAEGRTLRAMTADEPDLTACHVNHYFTRSKAHWMRKVKRGYREDLAIRRVEEFDFYDRNEVFDDSAVKQTPGLEQAVAALEERVATVVGDLHPKADAA